MLGVCRSLIFVIRLQAGKHTSRAAAMLCVGGILLIHSYKIDLLAVARHLRWPQARVHVAVTYEEPFSSEINDALAEHGTTGFTTNKRMLPQAIEFAAGRAAKH
jgi:hypothetical protein